MIESSFLTSLIGFFIVLTPLIFFHELGHYYAAKKTGVMVALSAMLYAAEGESENKPVDLTKSPPSSDQNKSLMPPPQR